MIVLGVALLVTAAMAREEAMPGPVTGVVEAK
jgi:hypothetical protein